MKLRKHSLDLTRPKRKNNKLGLTMMRNKTVNNIPRALPFTKNCSIGAIIPTGSESRAPPSDCNEGIDEPTSRTDSFNVLNEFSDLRN